MRVEGDAQSSGLTGAPGPTLSLGGRGRDLLLVLVGVCCGLTVYFKPTGAGLLAGLALAVVLIAWPARRRMAEALFLLGLGFVLSFAPLLAYFAAHGALDDLYQTVIVFNSYHARIGGDPTLAGSVMGTLDFLASMNVLAPLALAALWLLIVGRRAPIRTEAGGHDARPTGGGLGGGGHEAHLADSPLRRDRTAALVVGVWLVAAAAGIWTQGKFFSYHWSAVLPPLALLAAWAALRLLHEARSLHSRSERVIAGIVCLAIIVVYAAALGRDHAPKWQRNFDYLRGQTAPADYLATFGHNIQERDIYWFSQTQQAADYLRSHTSPDDRVLVWGFQALVNFLADRQAPTRYIFTYPLTFDRPETLFRVQARRTFLGDLRRSPPPYIVLVTNDVNPLQAVDSYGLLAGFPEFKEIIEQDYRLEADIGEFHIYRRIDA